MTSFKNSWKQTGAGLGSAFKGLGKTLINTGKKGVDHAVEWAGREQEQPAQNAQQPAPAAQPYAQTAEAQPAPQEQPVPAGAAPSSLVADEIKKLAALRDEGILTEEEFNAEKHRLLGL